MLRSIRDLVLRILAVLLRQGTGERVLQLPPGREYHLQKVARRPDEISGVRHYHFTVRETEEFRLYRKTPLPKARRV